MNTALTKALVEQKALFTGHYAPDHYDVDEFNDMEDGPQNDKKHVGIEIECMGYIERDTLAKVFKEAGLEGYLYIDEDSSIDTEENRHGEYSNNFEIKCCFEQTKYKKLLKKTMDILKALDFKVNRSCGMHIHLDMRTRDHRKCYHNLVSCQDLMYSLNKGRNTTFCKKVYDKDIESTKRDWSDRYSSGKYFSVNAEAYNDFETLEVRVHNGCVDYDRMCNWIDFLLKIVAKKTKLKCDIGTKKEFRTNFKNLNKGLSKFMGAKSE